MKAINKLIKILSLAIVITISLTACKNTTQNKSDNSLVIQSMSPNYNKEAFNEVINIILDNNSAQSLTDEQLYKYNNLAEESVLNNCRDRSYNITKNTINQIYYSNGCIIIQTVDSANKEYMYKLFVENEKISNCIVYELIG